MPILSGHIGGGMVVSAAWGPGGRGMAQPMSSRGTRTLRPDSISLKAGCTCFFLEAAATVLALFAWAGLPRLQGRLWGSRAPTGCHHHKARQMVGQGWPAYGAPKCVGAGHVGQLWGAPCLSHLLGPLWVGQQVGGLSCICDGAGG